MDGNLGPASLLGSILLTGCVTIGPGTGENAKLYHRIDLVSDHAGAAHVDTDLVNPWGVASVPGSFFWVANNGTGTSTLYDADGRQQSDVVGGPVELHGPGGSPAAPTGIIGNTSVDFVIGGPSEAKPAAFVFATEDGTLLAWNADVHGGKAMVVADHRGDGAIYKGLALSTEGGPSRLYATDFASGVVDVFDTDFAPVTLADGAFSDPSVPNGFVPFGIQHLDNHIVVTWVKPDSSGVDEEAGPGLGQVSEFDRDGVLLDTVASGGRLNAPWAVAMAPDGFGKFGGALLVGNFGDGRITAYDADTMDELGQFETATGAPMAIDGLWALTFGDGRLAGAKSELFFTAGPGEEAHGTFGRIAPR